MSDLLQDLINSMNANKCKDHKPVQFRDGKEPHCRNCGLTKDFKKPISKFDRKNT